MLAGNFNLESIANFLIDLRVDVVRVMRGQNLVHTLIMKIEIEARIPPIECLFAGGFSRRAFLPRRIVVLPCNASDSKFTWFY